MPYPPWPELALFMALVLVVFTYVMAASGHFPRQARVRRLATPAGTAVLWGTIIAVAITAALALVFAYQMIPWYASVIGGGLMILIAPYILQPFPDSFVDGPAALLLLAVAALALGFAAWRHLA